MHVCMYAYDTEPEDDEDRRTGRGDWRCGLLAVGSEQVRPGGRPVAPADGSLADVAVVQRHVVESATGVRLQR